MKRDHFRLMRPSCSQQIGQLRIGDDVLDSTLVHTAILVLKSKKQKTTDMPVISIFPFTGFYRIFGAHDHCSGLFHTDIKFKSTSNIMRFIILLVVSMLSQSGLSARIPCHSRSSVPVADTGFCAQNSAAIIDSTESSSIIPAISQTHQSHVSRHSSTTSFNKREPKHIFFHMGRFKSYYELHPEKATDHLYDIQDENTVGHEIVKDKGEHLMAQIWSSVEGRKKNVTRICA